MRQVKFRVIFKKYATEHAYGWLLHLEIYSVKQMQFTKSSKYVSKLCQVYNPKHLS